MIRVDKMIYFDNAATSGKKPAQVIRAVNNALINLSANPGRSGHKSSQRAALTVFRARQRIADFFNAKGPESVVFTSNCTHSINCVIKGVLDKGEHIIVSDLEHNAVMRPIYKSGIQYDMARVSFEDDAKTVANFEALIKKNTKMIFCTAASNVVGKVLPLEQLGALCREKGLLFAVDAAQAAGVLPIDMNKMNIDYLCIAPHKGLYAPMGIGILIADAHVKHTLIEGGTGTDSANPNQPDMLPERLESGTVNLPAIAGTLAGIDFVKRIGIMNIHSQETKLTSYLYKQFCGMEGIQLYTADPALGGYAPVLPFNIEGIASSDAADQLDKMGIALRSGLHCAPAAHRRIGTIEFGTLRFCPSVYSTKNEVDMLLSAIRKIKSKKLRLDNKVL